MTGDRPPPDPASLDPTDWVAFRTEAHAMLDGMVDFLAGVRDRPVWQPMPESVRQRLAAPLSAEPTALTELHRDFADLVRPYALGNLHPSFHGWAHGAGTPTGMLAEMLAGGLNANLGGRDHAPVVVERQVIGWMRDLFGFPPEASGLLVTGTSLANLIGVLVARRAALGAGVRRQGVQQGEQPLTAYASVTVHGCIAKAMDIAGLGSDALRRVPVGADFRLEIGQLRRMVDEDRARGCRPFLVVATAGSVDMGATDPLGALADFCAAEGLWLHVDGAFGALIQMSERLRSVLAGIERADSLAFDFHKWLHVPYDAGCVLVRDGALHRATFAGEAAYLQPGGAAAAGVPWFTDFGPDLSRGFRALKVWFTLREQGTGRLAAAIERTCALARHLATAVQAHPALELLAPVPLNIVCLRHVGRTGDADRRNEAIVVRLQEEGTAVPSTTRIGGRLAIRVAIFNHRTGEADLDRLVARIAVLGDAL